MRYVSLATDAHHSYSTYAPLACRLWRKLGWEPVIAMHPTGWGEPLGQIVKQELAAMNITTYPFDVYPPLSVGNTMRVARLTAPCLSFIKDDDIIMMSDVDVLPLSREFFAVDDAPGNATWDIYSIRADFQGFLQPTLLPIKYRFAMCYVGARARIWRDIFNPVTDDPKKSLDRVQEYNPEATTKILAAGGAIHPLAGDSTDMDELWMTAHLLTSKYLEGTCELVPGVSWCGYPVYQQGQMRLIPTRQPGGYPDRMMLLGEWRMNRDWDRNTALDWHAPRPSTLWLADVVSIFWRDDPWIKEYWNRITPYAHLTE